MAKSERSPTDYLSDTWGSASKSSDKSDNDTDDASLPFAIKNPPSPEYSPQEGTPGMGWCDDVETNPKGAAWGMSKDEISAGYSKPGDDAGKPGSASFEQNLPSDNDHNRGDDIHRNQIESPGDHANVGSGRDGKSRENL